MKVVVFLSKKPSLRKTPSPLIVLPLLSIVGGFLLILRIAEADPRTWLSPANLLSWEVSGERARTFTTIRFPTILITMSGTTLPLKTLASSGTCLTTTKQNTTISKFATSIKARAMNLNSSHSLLPQLLIKLLTSTTDGKLTRGRTRLCSKLQERWPPCQLFLHSSLETGQRVMLET